MIPELLIRTDGLEQSIGLYPIPGQLMSAAAIVATPSLDSRGSVKLASTNVYDQPLIDIGLLKSEFDWYGLRETIRAARRFFSAPAWESYRLTMEPPFNTENDEELNEAIKATVFGGMYPVGTASMSPKDAQWGVVDPDLRVKKVKGLRIIDASIMPFIVAAHTQAAVYGIAERGSDLIKHAWK